MKRQTTRSRRATPVFAFLLSLSLAYALPQAQTAPQTGTKKPLTVEDYTKWRNITGQDISGDGRWVTYVLRLTNVPTAETKPVLHILNLETNQDVAVPNATGGVFSRDSKWIAYQVDPNPGRGRGGRGAGGGGPQPVTPPSNPPTTPPPPPPVETPETPPSTQPAPQPAGRGATPPAPPRRVELRNLETGVVQSWENIGTFTFAPTSTHLFLKRRPAEAPRGGGGGRGGGQAPGATPGAAGIPPVGAGPRGTDTILLDLRTGRHQLLGSVGDIAFNRTGTLLAYTVDSAVKDANGLFVHDIRSGRTVALDNDAKQYNRLAWNDDANAIAVVKGNDVEKKREKSNVLIAFTDVPAAIGLDDIAPTPVVMDPATVEGFPADWVVSDRAPLEWSEDNKRIFFGIKQQADAPDTTRRTTDERQDVDVWNTVDERIQSLQMIRAAADRSFSFRQAFDVTAGRFVRLTDETMRDIDIAPDGRWAVGRDPRGYLHDRKRPAADFYRVDTSTGERTLMLEGHLLGGASYGISPHGTHFLFWKDDRLQAYDLDAGTARILGSGAPSFLDTEYDRPGPRPSYGLAGHTSDGKAVIAQHRYDLWLVPLDGSRARNLTGGVGAKHEMRFRYLRLQPEDPTAPRAAGPRGTIDLSKPIALAAYGQWTKRAGFYRLSDGELQELVYEDASFSAPEKAANADRYLFTRQTFVEFPDLRVSGPAFSDARTITDANPQQQDYVWGRRILFDYKNKDGVRLQGILGLPDDYTQGERRPMLVTFYEKNSQNLHRYSPPSYLTGMGSSPIEALSRGYLTMLPDIHFRTGNSHSDMLEAVEAATRKVIEMGYADPKRIGVTGHSYGGEGAAFIGTQSKMFAAVGMGAGVTDLFNDFNQNWGWSYQVQAGSGNTGFGYYLYGQGRWGFSPWENPEKYRHESALVHADKVQVPFLIMHGTADPTVGFENGLAFYNALRYNGKKAVLLAYPNEGHGLRGMANRKDLTIRYFQFFDHYLKDAPAPKWLAEGVPFLKKDEMREAK